MLVGMLVGPHFKIRQTCIAFVTGYNIGMQRIFESARRPKYIGSANENDVFFFISRGKYPYYHIVGTLRAPTVQRIF